MRCIILGAGEGTRLRPHTLDRPKCMVELAGKPILRHQLDVLDAAGVSDICVVTGYQAEKIDALGVDTIHNPDFATTNMVASLMMARARLDGTDDVLVAYADIAYERKVIDALRHGEDRITIPINTAWRELWGRRMADPLKDAETLKLDGQGRVTEIGKKPTSYDDIQGQYMGLIKIRADFAPQVVAIHDALDPDGLYDGKDLRNMYMTSFLQHIIDNDGPLGAAQVDGGWLEVDTSEELALYNRLHAEGRLDELCRLD